MDDLFSGTKAVDQKLKFDEQGFNMEQITSNSIIEDISEISLFEVLKYF